MISARAGEEGILSCWLRGLEKLTPVPPAYRQWDISDEGATALMRCAPMVLDRLVAAGLPARDLGGKRRFCRYDIFNLALYSGSGSSLPETGLTFALRFASQPPATWTAPRNWGMTVALTCPKRESGCQADSTWSIGRPLPELFGGAVSDWASPSGPVTVGSERVNLAGRGQASLSFQLMTVGKFSNIVSSRIAHLLDDLMRCGLRWQLLPVEWQVDPDDVMAHGIVNCVAASLYLEREYRALGYDAFARRGWLVGLMDLDHAWVEVRDDDGDVKVIDLTMALLARLMPGPGDDFVEFCKGSNLNRLLPSACRAETSIALHSCGNQIHEPSMTSSIKRN